jgi:hypothetical protein
MTDRLFDHPANRQQPRPFDWRFTKHDLFALLQRVAIREAAAKTARPDTLPSPT